jgi:hypothetical protein
VAGRTSAAEEFDVSSCDCEFLCSWESYEIYEISVRCDVTYRDCDLEICCEFSD